MNTEVKLNREARLALKEGVDLVADTVKVSLGAEGKNVVIPIPNQKGYTITKDGVKIAKSIFPENVYQAIGAALVKEAASKTNFEAGDGTTTATVLAQVIFEAGLELIDDNLSSVEIKKGMDAAVKDIIGYLKKSSKKVSKDNLKDIATISANGDKHLGELISKAFNKIGKHGTVITQESDTAESYIDLKDGVILERGWTSPVFKTDDIKDICVLDAPFVMLHRGKIEKGDAIVDLFDKVFSHPDGRLLILTDDIDPFVHSIISQNVIKNHIKNKICVVKMPQVLKIHKELLNDIAVLTGATIVSDEFGTKISVENLGRIEKCIINEKESVLVGDVSNIQGVIKDLKTKIKFTLNKFEKEELQERLSRISGGIATLYVGAKTDSELKEKKDRIEDSINATRSALEEGIVAGGGIALCNASNKLRIFKFDESLKDKSAYDFGYETLIICCLRPAIQICINADLKAITDQHDMGIDVKTGKVVNMFEAGIIDPAKVVRCALENAVSVSSLFLTTNAVVARFE